MRTRSGVLAALAAGVALLAPQAASAATEIGNNCQATIAPPNLTVVQIQNGAGNPPVAAPAAGVITEWRVKMPPEVALFPGQILKVMRPAGGSAFQVVAESASGTLTSGINSFDARVAIQAGDHLGLGGGGGALPTLACVTEDANNQLGVFEGNATSGSTQTYTPVASWSTPVIAVIEPDADGDGFGDETQDKCPEAASLQTECPVVVVDSFPLAKKSSIVVLVSTDESAPVTVSGTATFPKPAKKGSASAKAKLKNVTKTVPAGKLVRFTLKFPGSLKSALGGLPKGKSATVKLTATATDVAGRKTTDKAKLKLKGRS